MLKDKCTIYNSTKYSFTATEFVQTKLTLDTKTIQDTGELTLYNNGIKIGKGITKIKLSARIGVDGYREVGEIDMGIFKNNSGLIGVYGTNLKAEYKQELVLMPILLTCEEGDVFYLYFSKNSNKSLNILEGISTNLTIEAV